MRLLRYSEVKLLLLSYGYRESEARRLLCCNNPQRIPPHPHRLHPQSRWHFKTVKEFLAALEK